MKGGSGDFNNTLLYPAPPPTEPYEFDVPGLIYTIIGFFAAFENAIVISIVIKSKKFHKKRNIFLISLLLADFIVGILSFLIYFDYFYQSWLFGSTLDAMFLISMFSISAVCIERYIAIVGAPFTYRQFISVQRCVIVCVMYWSISILLVIVIYNIEYSKWTRLAFCCVSIITIFANYCLYFKMSRCLADNDRNVTEKFGKNVVGRSRKLIRSFSILLVIASICWLPLCCFLIIAVFYEHVDENLTVLDSLYCLAASNSFINPFIYWYRLPGIKEEISSLICCYTKLLKKSENNSHIATISTSSTTSPV